MTGAEAATHIADGLFGVVVILGMFYFWYKMLDD